MPKVIWQFSSWNWWWPLFVSWSFLSGDRNKFRLTCFRFWFANEFRTFSLFLNWYSALKCRLQCIFRLRSFQYSVYLWGQNSLLNLQFWYTSESLYKLDIWSCCFRIVFQRREGRYYAHKKALMDNDRSNCTTSYKSGIGACFLAVPF